MKLGPTLTRTPCIEISLKVSNSLLSLLEFEIALIKADQVVFNSQKVALLSFNIVSEQKAKN